MAQLMTKDEIHDFGIEVVVEFLRAEGHELVEVNPELGANPKSSRSEQVNSNSLSFEPRATRRKASLSHTLKASALRKQLDPVLFAILHPLALPTPKVPATPNWLSRSKAPAFMLHLEGSSLCSNHTNLRVGPKPTRSRSGIARRKL